MIIERDLIRRIETGKPGEECGVFGLYLHSTLASNQIVEQTLNCAVTLQNRGEQSSGICISDGNSQWPPVKRMGRINQLYEDYLNGKPYSGGLYGHIGITHNRYSTTGSPKIENASPYRFDTELGCFTVSHNGNITNAAELKSRLLSQGVQFSSTTDSEIIGALIASSPGSSWQEKIRSGLSELRGAFCLVISTKDSLYAAKDENGFHPLSIAYFEMKDRECYAVSSETTAFSKLPGKLKYTEDVSPGELIEINEEGLKKYNFTTSTQEAVCKLELTYLMQPLARFEGVQLAEMRGNFGRILARNHPAPENVDLVTYIPESAWAASKGYADELALMQNRQIPWQITLSKDRYVLGASRGFMSPSGSERKKIAKENYSVMDMVAGKNIVVVDDSVIEGTTTKGVVELYRNYVGELRDLGVREIHLRIVLPQVLSFCPFGVDIDDNRFLVAKEFGQNLDEIANYIGADSIEFMSLDEFQEGVDESVGRHVGLCQGCTMGIYPQKVQRADKLILEKHIH